MNNDREAFRNAESGFLRALNIAGYNIEFRYDMHAWCAWMRPQVGVDTNITFDPALNHLGPDNAFWMAVRYDGADPERRRDERDGLAACIACRLFQTNDYVEVIRSGRLWKEAGTAVAPKLCLPADMPTIAGRVGHHGGCYIRRSHRSHGLPIALTRLVRAMTGQMWTPQWHAGMIKQDPPPATELARKYGYTHEVPCIRGHSPVRNVTGAYAEINMTLIHRTDMAHQARQDSMLLQRHHREDLRDVMTILTRRTQKPKVRLRQPVVDAYN